MKEPTTMWDREPTDRELNAFYGKQHTRRAKAEIFEVLTNDIRKVPAKNLALPYVSVSEGHILGQHPLVDVIVDYGTDSEPLKALLTVLERSDCPLVQEYRKALAERYAYLNADEVEPFLE